MTYPNFKYMNIKERLEQISFFMQKENMSDEDKFRNIYDTCRRKVNISKKYTLDEIQSFIEQFSGLSIEEIKNPTRKREVIVYRQIAQHLAVKHTNNSLMTIALKFGASCHSTVLSNSRRVKNDLKSKDYNLKYYDFICDPEEYLKDKN